MKKNEKKEKDFTLAFPKQQDSILQQNAFLLFCWFY